MPTPADILILSNAPGELATWVKPVVRELKQLLGDDIRISVVLSPCPNASGQEAEIALSYPEVDRVQAARHFFPFLLWGKTAEPWDWHDRGVVVFLGGDQFFPLVIGKRLGYRTVIYAEWEARWHRWIDRFGVMRSQVVDRAPHQFAHKLTVVGDLMAEVSTFGTEEAFKTGGTLIGLLPGSKPAKLSQGVPLMLTIADQLWRDRPQTRSEIRFVIPVAPTLDLDTLTQYVDPEQNPVMLLMEGVSAQLVIPESGDRPYLKTPSGLQVELWSNPTERVPAYSLLSQCTLCITTVGANTAELGSLAVPMIVLLPTYQMDAMKAWDGLPGLLSNLPGVGSLFAKLINGWFVRRMGLLSWPNIWAQEAIVPELFGRLQPKAVAAIVSGFLDHPDKLQQMRDKLRTVRGEPGAARKFAAIVVEELARS
ncbi:lipid-A-disaccharide synthase [Phormidesmis sp. 146-33]